VRETDPVEIPSAAGLLILGLPQDPRLGGIAIPGQALADHLRQARLSLQDPVMAARARRLAARANLQIPTGLPDTEALIEALAVGLARRAIIGTFLPRASLGPPVAIPAPKPGNAPPAAFAGMSPEQRIRLLLERTPKALGPDLARAFRSLVTAEALAGIAAAFAVLLAAQFVGVGEIADAALAWWAYSQAGFAGLAGLYKALRAVVAAVRATSEAEFDQAVQKFAEGLTLVGVSLLTAVVTRAARRRSGGAEGGADNAPPFTRSKPDPTPQRGDIAPAKPPPDPIVWPPNRGFAGDPVAEALPAGTRLDRYGYEGGTFLSPEGTPVEARSLAPGTTDKPYNVYEVEQPITVQSGQAAPWFGQPGGGTQYELPMPVSDAIAQGYLKRVGP
jgi:hypothetical protein